MLKVALQPRSSLPLLTHSIANYPNRGSRPFKETGKVNPGRGSSKSGNTPLDRLEYTMGGCGTPAKCTDLIGGTLPFVRAKQRMQSF